MKINRCDELKALIAEAKLGYEESGQACSLLQFYRLSAELVKLETAALFEGSIKQEIS